MVNSLSTAQIAALTSDQMAQLTTAQVAALNTDQLINTLKEIVGAK